MRPNRRTAVVVLTAFALSCNDVHDGRSSAPPAFSRQASALSAGVGLSAAQSALNFAATDTYDWTTANNCVGCHRANDLFAGAVAAPAGLSVSASARNGLSWLATTLEADQQADGSWASSMYGEGARFARTASAAFQLASFGSLSVDAPALANVKQGLAWLQTQTSGGGSYNPMTYGNPPYAAGRYAIAFPNDGKLFAGQTRPYIPQDLGNLPETNWIITTAQTVIAASLLLQNDLELSAAETATFTVFENNLVDTLEGVYARGTPGTLAVQDLSFIGLALATSGRLPASDATATALLSELQGRQLGTSSWGDASVASGAGDALSTAEALYTLCQLGVSSTDPGVDSGASWLLKAQSPNGGWTVPGHTSDLATNFAAAALSCEAGAVVATTLSQPGATFAAGSAASTSTTLTITNPHPSATTCALSTTGGSATVSPPTLALAGGQGGSATVAVTLPPGLGAGSYPVSVVVRCDASTPSGFATVTQTFNVTVGAGAGTSPTVTTLTAGMNAAAIPGSALKLAATVSHNGAAVSVGTVTYYQGKSALGSVAFDPSSGTYPFTWSVPADAAGAQLLTAVFSGADTGSLARSSSATVITLVPPTAVPASAPAAPTITAPTASTLTVAAPPSMSVTGTCAKGASVTIDSGSTVIGSGVADSMSDAFSIAVTLPFGVNSITATQTVSGSTSPNSPPVIVTVTPTAPTFTLPANNALSATTSVAFSIAAATDASVTLYDSGASVGTFTSVAMTNVSTASGNVTLSYGAHTLTAIQAINGQTSAVSASVTVSVLPPAPTVSAPTANARYTNTNTIPVTATVQPGATLNLVDNGMAGSTLAASSSGSVSGNVTVGYGNHTLAFTQTWNGLTSAPTADIPVTVLIGAPTITSPATGTTINAPAVTVGGTALAGANITLSSAGSGIGTGVVNGNGQFSIPLTLTLGAHTISAVAAVGSASSVASTAVSVTIVDNTPPVITRVPANQSVAATSSAGATVLYTLPNATDDFDGTNVLVSCAPASGTVFPLGVTTVTCASTDSSKNKATVTFSVTVSSTQAPVLMLPSDNTYEAGNTAGVVVTFVASATDLFDGSTPVTCTPASGSTFPFGKTTVTCSATDSQGKTTTGAFHITVQDTTPPTVSVPGNSTIEAPGPAGTVLTFTATATDNVDGPTPVTCTPASGSTFPIGTTTVTCTSTDSHGNKGTGSFALTVRDTTPPRLSMPSNISQEATGAGGAVVTFSATATDAVDGPTPVTCAPASGSTFPLGVTVVSCTSTDAHANQTQATFSITVIDSTPPVLVVPSNIAVEATGPAGAVVKFAASATDTVDGARAVLCDPMSGSIFHLGLTTVSCSATDTHGNSSTATFVVTVNDTAAPVITTPPAVTAEATSAMGATLSFTVTANDAVEGPEAVICVPASGSLVPLGTTAVNCSASDSHGNQASAMFNVTVRDTTGPVISTTAGSTYEATSAAGTAIAFSATAVDLVDGATPVSCLPASGSTFPIGVTMVTCTSFDSRGNKGTAGFNVKVQDTVPPVVTVPQSITLDATSSSGAVATFTASATDNIDGVIAVTCQPPSGYTFSVGKTLVVCSAKDAHGNTGTGTFTVTVQDTVPPVLTLPMNITAEATGPAGAAITYNAAAIDAIDGPLAPACLPVSGSAFPLGLTPVNCTVADRSGNMTQGSFTVTVQDTTPPVLTLQLDETVEATGPAGRMITFQASAVDLVSGAVLVDCTPASGSLFPVGTTTVACSATDLAMNTASGSFNITVVETAPTTPALEAPTDAAVLYDGNLQLEWTASKPIRGATVSYTLTITPPSGAPITMDAAVNTVFLSGAAALPLGSYSWSVVAKDSRDVVSARSATWTFTIATPPPDAGPEMIDAGPPPTDAGPRVDAGTPDAGPGPAMTVDAGSKPPATTKQGGCATGSGNFGTLSLLSGLTLMLRRRRLSAG